MKTTYFDDEDTLVIRLSDKPIVREVSQDWRTHISYAADGSVVETVKEIFQSARPNMLAASAAFNARR